MATKRKRDENNVILRADGTQAHYGNRSFGSLASAKHFVNAFTKWRRSECNAQNISEFFKANGIRMKKKDGSEYDVPTTTINAWIGWANTIHDGGRATGNLTSPASIKKALAMLTPHKAAILASWDSGKKMNLLTPASTVTEVDDTVVEALESSHAKSQGFLLDSKLRKALEKYAMDAAKQHFMSQGYSVEDHSKDHPYDLRCTRNKSVRYVEVKGTQTNGKDIILTSGEVEFARRNKGQMALFILHSINVSKNNLVLTNGQKRLIVPWDVDEGYLKPMSFMYEVPQ
jgi:hypothetical protein